MAKSQVFGWLDKHANAVQGIASIVTALIALSALIGVKLQIDAAAKTQQEQSARDIYREFLNLSISKPEFSEPDYCAIKGTAQEAAYKNYVDYLLYTAEQMLSVSPDWQGALAEHLEAHEQYICGVADWSSYPENVDALITKVKSKVCAKVTVSCQPSLDQSPIRP
jgi:predicted component of type VI protein secretion system